MPVVLNRKTHGIPSDAVYVGRPSKWGNPFPMKSEADRLRVVELFCEYVTKNEQLMSCIHELRGKDLVCYCAPKLCHADILLLLANE